MKFFFPPIFLMFLIFILSSISMDNNVEDLNFILSINPTLQNLIHIPIFGLLAFLWLKAFTKHSILTSVKIIMTLIITILFGCLDEFHQVFVPGRYGSLSDIVLNIIGITTGIAVYLQREKVRSKQ